jgi:hypothetical protein
MQGWKIRLARLSDKRFLLSAEPRHNAFTRWRAALHDARSLGSLDKMVLPFYMSIILS